MRNLFAMMALLLGLFPMGQALAQSPSLLLAQHHREMTLSLTPGQLYYLDIPKQNYPVNIQISVAPYEIPIVSPSAIYGPYVASTVVTDIQGISVMAVPRQNLLSNTVGPNAEPYVNVARCSDPTMVGGKEVYSIGPGNADNQFGLDVCQVRPDYFVLGLTQQLLGNQIA